MIEENVRNPTWRQVETSIQALNNHNFNDVYLQPAENDSETYLCIGGGAGKYVLTGSIQNSSFPTLVDAARPAMPHSQVVIGGQSGDYPGNWIADLSTALVVARAFFDAGGFDCGAEWVSV